MFEARPNESTLARMLDPFPENAGLKPGPHGATVPNERRRRLRAQVRWEVRLVREPKQKAIHSITRDLSPEGFYCLSGEPFVPGEFLECNILIPTHTADAAHAFLNLQCLVQVVRVDAPVAEGLYGTACRIQEYRVVAPEPA